MSALFSEGERVDVRPIQHDESTFMLLERRAGASWARVRDLLEAWLCAFPLAGREDLAGRLRGMGREFRGAFLELYCHQLLLRSGWYVEPHPDIPGSSHHPDFAARHGQSQLYLEATVTAPSTQQVGANARLAKVIGEINRRIPTEDFSLDLLVEQVGQGDLSVRELCADIRTRLSRLDVEALLSRGKEPAWRWDKNGWQLDFTARPLAREHRRDRGRIIGSHGPGVHIVDEADPMLKALKNKASRYGHDLGRPYVIAIDPDGYPDYHDIHQVLFGPFKLSVQQPSAGVTSATWVRPPARAVARRRRAGKKARVGRPDY